MLYYITEGSTFFGPQCYLHLMLGEAQGILTIKIKFTPEELLQGFVKQWKNSLFFGVPLTPYLHRESMSEFISMS